MFSIILPLQTIYTNLAHQPLNEYVELKLYNHPAVRLRLAFAPLLFVSAIKFAVLKLGHRVIPYLFLWNFCYLFYFYYVNVYDYVNDDDV